MRTVITISLNGNAYQLDAAGHEALRAYLQVAQQRLAGNPDQMEILADLEQAIADKCGRYLGPHKNVVSSEEIAEVLREMGPVDAGSPSADTGSDADAAFGTASASNAGAGDGAGTPGSSGNASEGPPRRLYQIRAGSFISGVCTGLAAYLNIDVSVVRILFVLLALLTGGVWILVYIVMMFVIPYAQTSEQHAAAHGWPFNAEELVTRAKAHYAQFRQNSGKWQRADYRQQRRIWRHMWRDQLRAWKDQHRAWKRWRAQHGAPPPPPPIWGEPPPANANYPAQMVHSVVSPLAELLGAILFIAFLVALFSLVTHKRILGWWLPHEVPLWLGVVGLIVLYKVIASPLKRARYASYYGAPYARGWLAFIGALIWLGGVAFLVWLAWQHHAELQDLLQNIGDSWRSMMERRASPPESPGHTVAYFVAWGVPSGVLPGCAAYRELEAHGEIDRADVFGEATDRDVVDAGLGDRAYGLQ